MRKRLVAVVTAIFLLTACNAQGPKETAGTLLGAAGGGLIGAQFGKGSGQLVGVALGAFLGSQLGAYVGRSMDENDKRLAAQTAIASLESSKDNRTKRWQNPNNNHSGYFTVLNTEERSNTVCRDYKQGVTIDNKTEEGYGRACRDMQSGSNWQMQ